MDYYDIENEKPLVIKRKKKLNGSVSTTSVIDIIDNKTSKALGQYFTISEQLQQIVFDKVKNKGSLLLEPSFGAGHLLKKFKEYDDNYPIICYELDSSIKPILSFNSFQNPIYGDFTLQRIEKRFKTIIGNPPYVKMRSGNLYLKFIEICFHLLDEKGEMIFIVPSDFIKLTGSSSIIQKMISSGSFTDFWFPNNERLFENASIDVLIFRYEKDIFTQKTLVNDIEKYCNVYNGIITFSESPIIDPTSVLTFENLFNIYVGLVSGRDEIYKVPFGNIEVLVDKDRIERFIYVESFPSGVKTIDDHLIKHKSELLGRRIRKFNEMNWYEWGAPRNISSIRKYWGESCIYLRNLTRNREISFMSRVQNFGGSLLCLVPKNKMNETELEVIIDYLNSETFQKDYIYSGRFKIGHKQISNALIHKSE